MGKRYKQATNGRIGKDPSSSEEMLRLALNRDPCARQMAKAHRLDSAPRARLEEAEATHGSIHPLGGAASKNWSQRYTQETHEDVGARGPDGPPARSGLGSQRALAAVPDLARAVEGDGAPEASGPSRQNRPEEQRLRRRRPAAGGAEAGGPGLAGGLAEAAAVG